MPINNIRNIATKPQGNRTLIELIFSDLKEYKKNQENQSHQCTQCSISSLYMRDFLTQLDTVIYQIERVLLVSALIVMALVVFIQVVLRFFESGFPWAEELARYLMIWAGFLGASIATRQRRHLKIDILPRFLPDEGNAKATVMRLASLISAGFCVFLVVMGSRFMANAWTSKIASTSLKIPMWIVRLSIPLTLLIMACRFLGQAFGELQEEEEFERLVER